MKKWVIELDNDTYCGCLGTFAAYAESQEEFEHLRDLWAYDHFEEMGGYEEDDDLTEDEVLETLTCVVKELDLEEHEYFDDYEVLYDGRK